MQIQIKRLVLGVKMRPIELLLCDIFLSHENISKHGSATPMRGRSDKCCAQVKQLDVKGCREMNENCTLWYLEVACWVKMESCRSPVSRLTKATRALAMLVDTVEIAEAFSRPIQAFRIEIFANYFS